MQANGGGLVLKFASHWKQSASWSRSQTRVT